MKKKSNKPGRKAASRPVQSPTLSYLPPKPGRYHPKIALIGCGGITGTHLGNYRKMGLDVVALCDLDRSRAEQRAKEFFPQARIFTNHREVLACEEIAVVDIATHPADRLPVIEAALKAKKHVLSQKPFVLDLAAGRRLAALAKRNGVRLAVNQNGRWAPHWSYLTQLVHKGHLGEINTVDFTVSWDHSWTKNTPFNTIHHLVLYDFAVHWFDIASVWMRGKRAKSVAAILNKAARQEFDPPGLAAVIADYGNAQVRFNFNAANKFDRCDRTLICGSKGTALSCGPGLDEQKVQVTTAKGTAEAALEGSWFTNGFQGTMGELLTAIEQKRDPSNSAENNLASLELCFAALASAECGRPVRPGQITKLEGELLRHCRTK